MSKPLVLIGPFAIQAYGLMIAIGVVLATLLCIYHPLRKRFLTTDQLLQSIATAIVVGVISGRILCIATHWSDSSWIDLFYFWQGGFSVLGTVIGIAIYLPWYLSRNGIPILPTLDLLALHAPLTHAIARIGCFISGCCYGSTTLSWWAVRYTDADATAPLYITLHPAQLYSAFTLFIIFIFLMILDRIGCKPGTLLTAYLLSLAVERFIIDFFRGDREYISIPFFVVDISLHQLIACLLFIGGLILYFTIQRYHRALYYT